MDPSYLPVGDAQAQPQAQAQPAAPVSLAQQAMSPDEVLQRTNLIVNFLPSSVDDAKLRSMFQQFGPIDSLKVRLDKVTRQSQGYGFVRFTTIENAARAIEGMNGFQIENKRLKVAYAHPPLESRPPNVYFSHLEPAVTTEVLRLMVQPFGTIVEAKVLVDNRTSQSRGIGFVRFEQHSEAAACIAALNGLVPTGFAQAIECKFADSAEEKNRKKKAKQVAGGVHMMGAGMRYNPMGMGGMGGMPMGGMGGMGGGAAFGNQAGVYRDPNAMFYGGAYDANAAAAAAGYNPAMYGQPTGNYMAPQAGMGMPQAQMGGAAPAAGAPGAQAFSLFVFNLPQDADEGLLWRLFGPFGAVSQVSVIRDAATKKCKGFGFVNFLKYEEAYAAVGALNGSQLGGKALQVSFKQQKQ